METGLALLAGAIAIAVCGFGLDLWIGRDFLARSGAVIVVYGISLVGRALYQAERAMARHDLRLEKLEAALLDAIAAGTEIGPESFRKIAEHHGDYRLLRFDRMAALIRVEISIVCFGTLVWGFGDLAV